MPSEFRLRQRVEFADTDAAGIMHFAAAFRLMEVTEHAFFRSFGYSIQMVDGDHSIGWPRVHVSCDYQHPLYFEDEVDVELLISDLAEKSITYEFRLHKVLSDSHQLVAIGRVKALCVASVDDSERPRACAIPAPLRTHLETVSPERLGGRG